MLYYRLKNPVTKEYYCRAADQVDEAPLENAIVYTEEVAKKILPQANQIGGLFTLDIEQATEANFEKARKDFPGYQLEKVSLADIVIPEESVDKIRSNSRLKHISFSECKLDMIKELVEYWSQWAAFNPFDDEEYPSVKNPFADENKFDSEN